MGGLYPFQFYLILFKLWDFFPWNFYVFETNISGAAVVFWNNHLSYQWIPYLSAWIKEKLSDGIKKEKMKKIIGTIIINITFHTLQLY